MEYGLGQKEARDLYINISNRLNPCFNGIWSRTPTNVAISVVLSARLNPCFNGIWSRTHRYRDDSGCVKNVLILVLMEYGLGPGDLQVVETDEYES